MRTIAHISDLHYGKIDLRIVEGLVADLSARSPSLVVVSGDLTQRARRRQFQAAAKLLARLPGPQLVVPGNHDIPLYDLLRRFLFPLDRYRRYVTSNLLPIWRDDEMIVIGLNTARSFSFTLNGFWKDGRLSQQQLMEVRRLTSALPPELFRVVVTHHPFIPPPGRRHGIIRGAARALEVLGQCGVDLLLAGHLHMVYSSDVRAHHQTVARSILSVQAGSAASTRRRGQKNAYNWITIQPDQVKIEVRTWDGATFADGGAVVFKKMAGLWQRL